MHQPIFIIGTQRSGTTLLGRILSAHPDVFIKNEIPVRSVFTPESSCDDIEQKISHFVEQRYGKSTLELLKSEGKKIWGLKDPELTFYLEPLKNSFPNARFIIIVRDARAVVNSYIKNKWGLGTNAYTGAIRWQNEVEKHLAFESENLENVFRLRYEDLVINQEKSLKDLCSFLNIPFSELMLAYSEQKSYLIKNRENKNTFRAPDPELTSKWRSELTHFQICVIESVCRELLNKLDYSLETDPYNVPQWMRLYYCLHQILIGEMQIQYRWRFKRYQQAIKIFILKNRDLFFN